MQDMEGSAKVLKLVPQREKSSSFVLDIVYSTLSPKNKAKEMHSLQKDCYFRLKTVKDG